MYVYGKGEIIGDSPYELDLRYEPPTKEEAVEWMLNNPEGHVAAFACYYPGRYYEAASLIRKLRQQMTEEEYNASN